MSFSFDLFMFLAEYMDVKSLVALSASSRTMYEAVNSSRGLWSRILLQQIDEAHLAPLSIPSVNTLSVDVIRRYATRPFRLESCLTGFRSLKSGSVRPLATLFLDEFRRFDLSFGNDFEPVFSPLIRLAPGGRWVIGIASTSTQLKLFCWDLLSAITDQEESFLEPVAMIVAHQPITRSQYRTFEMQYDEADRCVNILWSYSSTTNLNRECELIQLLCSPDVPPILERRASLPRLNDRIAAYHFRLNGNVVCVQGSDLVYLWNWRDGTRGWVCDHDRVGESDALMCGNYILVSTEDYPPNVYEVHCIESLPPASRTLERATSRFTNRVKIDVPHFAGYRPEFISTNQWSPPGSMQTVTAIWKSLGVSRHIVKFSAPDQMDVLGTDVEHRLETPTDWQSLPSCYVNLISASPGWSNSTTATTHDGRIIRTTPWSVCPLEISCRGVHDDPLFSICPTSGAFFSVPDYEEEETDMESIPCTVFYFD